MSPVGSRNDPFLNKNFFVEIDGILQAGFQEVSGLEAHTDVVEYRQGGNPFIAKYPGKTIYSNVVLKWGMTASKDLWDWYGEVRSGKVIKKRNLSIIMFDGKQSEIRRWNLYHAFPIRWKGPVFSAKDQDVAIESLEIAYEYFQLG